MRFDLNHIPPYGNLLLVAAPARRVRQTPYIHLRQLARVNPQLTGRDRVPHGTENGLLESADVKAREGERVASRRCVRALDAVRDAAS